MGTKNRPGTYDCYANAHPDEPMFVLLGRDPMAADLVDEWARLRELRDGPSAKVQEARTCARAMRAWATESESARPAPVSDLKPGARVRIVHNELWPSMPAGTLATVVRLGTGSEADAVHLAIDGWGDGFLTAHKNVEAIGETS
ncbi:MAG: hypothetical protein JWP97_2521 [Labilithrix sp.]|nr:hypothetical protein [Labilithrix sp.]